MNRKLQTVPLALVAAALLAACGRDAPAESQGGFDRVAERAVTGIREEMATENISLGRGHSNLPEAELTPQGDLIIDGKTLVLDPKQRELALAYRGHLAQVAETGARVGIDGAVLASKALTEAARAMVNGEDRDAEARIEADAAAVRASARALCEHLPALHAAQQELAAAVPEFAPYATMDRKEFDDCRAEVARS
jgi:hypothetical protein